MTEKISDSENALPVVAAWNEAWLAQDLERMKEFAAEDFIQWHATIRKNLSKAEEFAMLTEAVKVMKREGEHPSIVLSYQERQIYWYNEEIDRRIGVDRVPEGLRMKQVLGPYAARS